MTQHDRYTRVRGILFALLILFTVTGCTLFESSSSSGDRSFSGSSLGLRAGSLFPNPTAPASRFNDSTLVALINNPSFDSSFNEFVITEVVTLNDPTTDDNAIRIRLRGQLTENTMSPMLVDSPGSDIDDLVGIDISDPDPDDSNNPLVADLTFRLQDDVPPGGPFGENSPNWRQLNNYDNLYYRNRARRFARLPSSGSNPILSREDNLETGTTEPTANYVEYHAVSYVGDSEGAGLARQEIVRVEVVLIPDYDDGVADEDPDGVENNMDNFNVLEGDNIGLRLAYAQANVRNQQDSAESLPSGNVRYEGLYMGHNRVTIFPTSAISFNDFTFTPTNFDQLPIMREANAPRMTINVDFAVMPTPSFDFTIRNAQLRINQRIRDGSTGEMFTLTGSGSMDIIGSGSLDEALGLTSQLITEDEDGMTSIEQRGVGELQDVTLNVQIMNRAGNTENIVFPATDLTIGLDPDDNLRSIALMRDDRGIPILDNNRVVPILESGAPIITNTIHGLLFDRGIIAADAVAGSILLDASGSVETTIAGSTIIFGVRHQMRGVFIAEQW